mmetsp:Transcript_19512/g.28058  ORF Transcript_19512/g.28058 Transcript_19512/m.28058 type:complete len:129 (+) Transcript_19512:49-435(+)|eukprot:CAMPEP_0185019278 /NCGR_PEP_ID=MMETSP1103-20130426/1891_1 /TAXON_ID=36769 /ORGANISM="Paraphysomonas bandaiensis, Strain Caron Lab Isolate" /LENGTH=128 /DNA_ID=CAMNT_0027549487 /DNA_START=49 /DNA_END=435 /DNA_ORIENTATION=-
MEKPVVLDWPEAMNQVGGDKEFLSEVLQDLLDEAKTAEEDIAKGIQAQNHDQIMKAAHRIKGSATYLGCEALRISSYNIQQLGLEGLNNPADEEPLVQVKKEYSKFLLALEDLRVEINQWMEQEGGGK